MDPRAYTYDPNALLADRFPEDEKWWHDLGPTRKPSPYATATWTFYQEVQVEQEILPNFVDDTGLDRIVDRYFATIGVYDGRASFPGNYNELLLDPSNTVSSPYEVIEEAEGTLLGQLSYEILDGTLLITDWSHYNWHDATPVKRAFIALIANLPECVQIILVEDSPHSFWVSLGFVNSLKGSDLLIYNDKILKPVPY